MLSWLPIRLYKVRVEIPRSAATRLDGHCRRPLLIENLQACAKIVSAEIDGGGPGVLRCPADRLRPFPSRGHGNEFRNELVELRLDIDGPRMLSHGTASRVGARRAFVVVDMQRSLCHAHAPR